MRIKTRMLLGALAVATLGQGVMLLVETRTAAQGLRERELTHMRSLARFEVAALERELATTRAALESIATHMPVAASTFQKVAAERPLAAASFNTLVLIGVDGVVLSDVPATPGFQGRNVSDREYFKAVMNSGRTEISSPFVAMPSSRPAVALATPLKDPAGAISGIVVGTLLLDQNNLIGRVADRRIGNTGYFTLMTADRIVLSSPTPSPPGQLRSAIHRVGENRLLDEALSNASAGGEARNRLDVPVIFASERVRGTDWTLIAVMPTDEAYATVEAMTSRGIALGVLVVLFAVAVVAVIVHFALRPLANADAILSSLEAGAPSAEPPPSRFRNEIDDIALRFAKVVKERDEANARLRQLASDIQLDQEAERFRTAETLHEQVAQEMSAARMMLQVARKHSQADPAAHIDAAIETVKSTLAITVGLAQELRPALVSLTLDTALARLGRTVSERSGRRVRMHGDVGTGTLLMSDPRAVDLYRMGETLLGEAVGQNGDATIELECYVEDGRVELRVLPLTVDRSSRAFTGVEVRVDHLGGTLTHGESDMGPYVRIIVPMGAAHVESETRPA